MLKNVSIREKDGKFHLSLSENAMLVLASMVRLEMGQGWENDNQDVNKAAAELLAEINKKW